jgi:uncharacterized protein (TIGR01777 family)
MKVTVTGATGLIGSRLVDALKDRGDDVTVLSRRPDHAREALGVEAVGWRPKAEPAPADALSGRHGVVHLAGETIGKRWSKSSKRQIRDSRTHGTANLVLGLGAADSRPGVLACASAVGIYGARGAERIDESAPPGDDFLATVTREWEAAARKAEGLGMRVVSLRTGVVLDRRDGALRRMLPPFRLGLGGPVAGGYQYMPWIHIDDVVGMYLAALDDPAWSGPINATAPEPATNAAFSKALGRALGRPAFVPVPGPALRLLFGEMAMVVTEGQRVVPARAQELGYEFRHPDLDGALRAAIEAD